MATPEGARQVACISAGDFAGKEPPHREYHVDELVPANTVTLLSGDGGTGKSQLALQLATATVAELLWCGMRVRRGGAMYLSAEDDVAEIHRRLDAICRNSNIAMGDLSSLKIIPLAGEDAVLAAPDRKGIKPTPLFAAIEAQISCNVPKLIVVDTLADVFGGQENERAQARQFIGMLRGWAIRHEASVLVLSHPSLSGLASGSGTSGSTAWSNSVRSRLYLDRVKGSDGFESDPDTRVLRTVKSNYGRIGGEVRLRWRDGIFVSLDEPAASSAFGAIAAEARADRIFLELLAKITAEGRYLSPHPTSNNYGPTFLSRHPNSEGITRRGFEAALHRLFDAGRVRVGKSSGPPSKQHDIIEANAPASTSRGGERDL